MKYRIMLNAIDLQNLMEGKSVKTKKVEIYLSDMGFHKMHKALNRAMKNHAATHDN